MASISASCLRFQPSFHHCNKTIGQAANRTCLGLAWAKSTAFPSLKATSFRVSCAAKPETVQKVYDIVRKQLVLPAEVQLTPQTKFTELGADSLDTVEIVMNLEEEFNIGVEEENSQNIATIQDAADLIEDLVQKKAATGS